MEAVVILDSAAKDSPAYPGLIDGTPMAPIDWPEAIAALDRGRLTGLDSHNADLVCDAVKHATGHR